MAKSAKQAAEEILDLRRQGWSDTRIESERPDLSPGFKLANLQAKGSAAKPQPAGSGPSKTREERRPTVPFH